MSIETRDYMTAEYIDLFESMNAGLWNRRRFRKIHYL
jgi:hypothetical protein